MAHDSPITDAVKVCRAATWVMENAGDGGYPVAAAVDAFRLTPPETNLLQSLVDEMHRWLSGH